MRYSFSPDDDDSDDESHHSNENISSDEDDEDDEEEEPHPIGFGKTRYGIHITNLLLDDEKNDFDLKMLEIQSRAFTNDTTRIQSYPPVYSNGRMSQCTVDPSTLMQYYTYRFDIDDLDDRSKDDMKDSNQLFYEAFSNMTMEDDVIKDVQNIKKEDKRCLLNLQNEILRSSKQIQQGQMERKIQMNQNYTVRSESYFITIFVNDV